MPMKLSVGLTKKVGLPDYGSVGASCHLELELDQSLVTSDLDGFHERVQRTFVACRQAVEQELAQNRPARSPERAQAQSCRSPVANGNGQDSGNGHRASQKQIDYAQQLAGQIKGLGVRRLESLARKMFSKPLADLSSLDASGLIDALKDIKNGTIDLAAALNGAAQ